MSELSTFDNSHAWYDKLEVNFVDSKPIMKVEVLGEEWSALLDSGSACSLIGSQLIPQLHKNSVKLLPTTRQFLLAAGTCLAVGSVIINIKWPGGIKRHHFYLLEQLHRAIILGRDFLVACNISVHLKERGWTVGLQPQVVIPFERDLSLVPANLVGHCAKKEFSPDQVAHTRGGGRVGICPTIGAECPFETQKTNDGGDESGKYPVMGSESCFEAYSKGGGDSGKCLMGAESCSEAPQNCAKAGFLSESSETLSAVCLTESRFYEREEVAFCEPSEFFDFDVIAYCEQVRGEVASNNNGLQDILAKIDLPPDLMSQLK